jgi:putative membrane protein
MLTTLSTAAATHWGGPWMGGFHWFFLLIPLFWIAVIVLLAVFIGRRRRAVGNAGGYGYGHGPWRSAARSAEQTLAERFAQGDIDEVEYRARLEVLRANDAPPQR